MNVNSYSLRDIERNWDLVVIGGGITGAGIFLEASKRGLKTILLEQKDFAWGTSSRSSKLIHGGLRYLKQGRFDLTYASVKEREFLVKDATGLIEYLPFIMPVYSIKDKLMLKVGLGAYSFMAGKKQHRYYNNKELIKKIPTINTKGLVGGFQFLDARVDDARLTLRAIFEAIQYGGLALNYTKVKEIIRNNKGVVTGVTAVDTENGDSVLINTKAVINAAGVWSETLHKSPFKKVHIRPLRGSHIVFPYNLFPIEHAISFVHPDDRRPVFLIPWEGVTIYGTTDVDHSATDLMEEPHMSLEEFNYLIKGLKEYFPNINIGFNDCISTFSGVRPVLSKGGKKDPSKESRDDIIFEDRGLVTITGGKLTIFRKLACDALKAAKGYLPGLKDVSKKGHIFKNIDNIIKEYPNINSEKLKIIFGRYSDGAKKIIEESNKDQLEYIPGTKTLWGELPYIAKNEQVRHLEDILLRRVRIGNQLPEGGKRYLDKIYSLCSTSLNWDKTKWEEEKRSYINLWNRCYSLPRDEKQSEED
ncbi:MAG: glycerol-3-phosphate dehydrogenase/oxidase [Deferribacterota bacterium]|nr:glycerol-3-phosphate dehydrogenase/oxidase [Deferribacterota bacterium]